MPVDDPFHAGPAGLRVANGISATGSCVADEVAGQQKPVDDFVYVTPLVGGEVAAKSLRKIGHDGVPGFEDATEAKLRA